MSISSDFLFVQEVVHIYPGLLKLFQNVSGVWFFWTQRTCKSVKFGAILVALGH